MWITRQANRVVVRSPAKVNLFLDVLGRRDDGFHEVTTVMCPVSIIDSLELELTTTGQFKLDITFATPPAKSDSTTDIAWDIPADSRNLVIRALTEIRQEMGLKAGAAVRLTKQIPAAAGLGGGSGNAAAAIVAYLASLDAWDRDAATAVAARLGSDIPFFLGNERNFGLAEACGRGEQISPLEATPKLDFLLTHPPVGCSTAAIYGGLNTDCLPNPHTRQLQEKLVAACESGELRKIGAGLFNALQSSAEKHTSWIETQLRLFDELGLEFRLMSGSGSSCFALIDDSQNNNMLLEQLRAAAAQRGIERVFAASAVYGSSIEQQIRQWAS